MLTTSLCFDPQALTSLTQLPALPTFSVSTGFDPQALTSLTLFFSSSTCELCMFRSTGSYEPDPYSIFVTWAEAAVSIHRLITFNDFITVCFDPQALTSLTRKIYSALFRWNGFDPQALTSLTRPYIPLYTADWLFRSTGSYEPDPTDYKVSSWIQTVSIHRLLRA